MQYKSSEVPTIFQTPRASSNLELLKKELGPRFLTGAGHAPSSIKHPILQRWVTNGVSAFIELNSLAEDIRCVHKAQGFEHVLHDLKQAKTCMATWHTLHSAALLARGPLSHVERFFPQTHESLPDFMLRSPDGLVACEAKHLAVSGHQETFSVFSERLSSLVESLVFKDEISYPTLTIVIKSVETYPDIEFLIQTIGAGLKECTTSAVVYKHRQFNIYLDPPDAPPYFCQKAVYIFGRKSEKEDLRVQKRGQQASSQLSVPEAREYPGLLILSVGHLQDPEFIEGLFQKRFQRGEYSGISAAMLLRTGNQVLLPEAAPFDLVSIARNPQTARPLPNLRLDPVGIIGRLRNDDQTPQVPAYRYQVKQLRVVEGSVDQSVYIPDITHLTPEMLED